MSEYIQQKQFEYLLIQICQIAISSQIFIFYFKHLRKNTQSGGSDVRLPTENHRCNKADFHWKISHGLLVGFFQ